MENQTPVSPPPEQPDIGRRRRKVAIVLGYCGVGYKGMQNNPGAKTIEADLQQALYLSAALPENHLASPTRYDFARSARTDKGVSAIGQVVSGNFYLNPPGTFLHRLNTNLPPQIRAFGYTPVTLSFNAKKSCDKRRYVYLLPLFALNPNIHRDRKSVLVSSGNKGEDVLDYGEKKRRFNEILKQYEGTHNFHNFTTRVKANDPSVIRCIVSFRADDATVTVDGIEFVKCEVVGQSFMLHQIRKMIGVAVAVIRNSAPESFIQTALRQDVKVNVPTAPGVGLYLDECFFSLYNQKWKDTHEEVSMKAYVNEAEEFKLKHIYPHIASTEHKYGTIAVWLHSLNHRNYPDLCPKEKIGANEVSTQSAETTRINIDPLNYRNYSDLGREENSGAYEVAGTKTEETTRCNGTSCDYEKVIIHNIDLEHLGSTMKSRLNLVLPFIHELRVRYNCGSDTETTDTIISDVNMMVDTAMSVTYNRLRLILQSHEPTGFSARMNPKSPLSNRYKFPSFISSVLSSIGPLRIMDGPQDMLVVYATTADRSQTYGRAQSFDFIRGHFFRLINNLAAIGVPLAPINVKGSNHNGSFFPTILPDRKYSLWEFTATWHYSNYKHRDIMSAWLTVNDDPALSAFPEGVPEAPAHYCTSLARDVNEDELTSMLREYIWRYDSSWTSPSFK